MGGITAALGAKVAGLLGVMGPVTQGTAMAYGAGTAVAGAGAAVAAGKGIQAVGKILTPKLEIPGMKDLTTPGIADMAGTVAAKAKSKRSAIARSRSIFTSPLGIAGEADVAKKTLLGQ